MLSKISSQLIILLCCIMLTACSSSGGGDEYVAEGGIKGTGKTELDGEGTQVAAVGPITGFGSIFVNGVKFETDNAEISVNGNTTADDGQLKLGMVVQVLATTTSDDQVSMASQVVFDSDIIGPITEITEFSTYRELVVLGRHIIVREDSVFDGISFETLVAGQVVAISGLANSDGELVASRIEKISDEFVTGQQLEVEGTIIAVDPEMQLIVVDYSAKGNMASDNDQFGNNTFDYSEADLSALDGIELAVGLQVDISGSRFNELGQLVVDSIAVAQGYLLPVGVTVQVKGFIDNFVSLADFSVDNQAVDASNIMLDEATVASMKDDTLLKVSGVLNEEGTLIAEMVKVQPISDVFVEGQVTAIDATSNSLVVLGVTLTVDALTAFEDQSDDDERYYSFASINVGDSIRAWGYQQEDGVVVNYLSQVEEEDEVEIEGLITAISGTQITVLGTTIDVSSEALASLLLQLQVGSAVEVQGVYTDNQTIFAREIEIIELPEDDTEIGEDIDNEIDEGESVEEINEEDETLESEEETNSEEETEEETEEQNEETVETEFENSAQSVSIELDE